MKKLTRRAVRFNGVTLGLDVHKRFIQFSAMDGDGNEIAEGKMKSDRAALAVLLETWLAKGAVQVCLEACGCFLWIFDALVEKIGRANVHVAQPGKLAVIAKSMEKNDANDAWWLAYLLYEGRLPEAFVAEGTLLDLRIAERELRWYTRMRAQKLTRIKAHAAQACVTLPSRWYLSKIGRKKARELLAEVKAERGQALKLLLKTVAHLSRQMQHWRARLQALSALLPQVQVLSAQMPGMGKVLSATVYGELGDPKRFYSEKAYSKATGLTPGYRKTGGREAKMGISRQGSALARWALTNAAASCLRCKRGPGLARSCLPPRSVINLTPDIFHYFSDAALR